MIIVYICEMNLYKKIVSCVCMVGLSLSAMAASRVEYLTVKHDFGTINEADGKAS